MKTEIQKLLSYHECLLKCSRLLLTTVRDEAERNALLTEVLEVIRRPSNLSSAFLFRNFYDRKDGFCSGIVAQACAPGIPSILDDPFSQKIPWSICPPENFQILASGQPLGGATRELFGSSTPEFTGKVEALAIRVHPIHIDGEFWGYVGYDDCVRERVWEQSEITVLRTASKMIAGFVSRCLSEEMRRFGESSFQQIADSLPQMISIATRDGALVYSNRELLRESCACQPYEHGLLMPNRHPDDDRRTTEKLKRCLKKQTRFESEYRVFDQRTKQYRWHLGRAVPLHDESGAVKRWFITSVDIENLKRTEKALTETSRNLEAQVAKRTARLKRSNDRLKAEIEKRKTIESKLIASNNQVQELAGKLIRAQDEERKRIARELHDSTAQNLFAITVNLAKLERGGVLSAVERHVVEESLVLGEQVMNEIRDISYLLYPPLLEQAGLVSTVEWYADGFAARSDIEVRLEMRNVPRFDQEIELALFRIVQECLTNIQKHSGSATVAVSLSFKKNKIHLTIRDEGRGMPRRTDSKDCNNVRRNGLGLQSIRQRTKLLGGKLEIKTDSNGTEIAVSIPAQTKK